MNKTVVGLLKRVRLSTEDELSVPTERNQLSELSFISQKIINVIRVIVNEMN